MGGEVIYSIIGDNLRIVEDGEDGGSPSIEIQGVDVAFDVHRVIEIIPGSKVTQWGPLLLVGKFQLKIIKL